LGARTADQRILHFMLEIWCRLMVVGEASADGFTMRMTQQQIADVLGLSLVHTNKMMKSLTRRNLMQIDQRFVTIPELKDAIRMADFDPAFLDTFRTAAIASSGFGKLDDRMDQISQIAEEVAEEE
jgi:DNA-binding transcriptional regulator LsrR (DeoR family)